MAVLLLIVCTEFFALSSFPRYYLRLKMQMESLTCFSKTNVLSKIYAGVVEINIYNGNDNNI